jgi:hypothetical protein
MKTFFILISTLLLIVMAPKEEPTAPFKKCNTIKIIPPENDTTILKNFADFLDSKGIYIQSFNPDIDNLKTEWFILDGAVNTKSQIFARYDDTREKHVFYVTGYYAYGIHIDTKKYKMAYKNPNFSTDGALFQLVDIYCKEFAAQYGYQVFYQKR